MSTTEPLGNATEGDPASAASSESSLLKVRTEAPADGSMQRGRTWAHGMPAMRIGGTARERARRARAMAGDPPAESTPRDADATVDAFGDFGPRIRVMRAVVGMALIMGAWLAALGAYLLGRAALAPLGRLDVNRLRLAARALARIVEALGACFIGVVAAMMILVGAFALALAIRQTDIADVEETPTGAVAADETATDAAAVDNGEA